MVKKYLPLIIILLISFLAAWPLLTSGFIPTHDAEYHLIRFFEFDKNFKAGNFFPNWAPGLNSGFGVPLFEFFYPLPNYFGEFFHLFGFSFVESLKLTLATGIVLGALFFYFWLADLLGQWPALVGAVFYTLAPYHLVDVYVRGTVGEVIALAFFPAVLWGIQKKSLIAAFFLALVILSHNILAMIFMPFVIIYLLFFSSARYSLLVIFLALGLSCYFWLPALAEAKYVVGLRMINPADHFPAFWQLILPSWGTGYSVPGIGDNLSFQIGIPHLLVVVLIILRRKLTKTFFFLGWLVVLIFFLLEISSPFWKLIPLMSYLQYPWRLLSLIILVTSFLAALIASRSSKLLTVALILMAIIFYGSYARPIKYAPRSDSFYLDNPTWTDGTATLGNSFSTAWLPVQEIDLMQKRPKLEVEKGEVFFNDSLVEPTQIIYQITAGKESTIKANISYFPGWQVMVNNQLATVNFDDGLIHFSVPKGQSEVKIRLRNTPIRDLADYISIASLLFGISTYIVSNRTKK